MKLFSLLLISFVMLSGCSNMVHYQYKDKSLPDSEIAKIRKSNQKSLWTPFISSYKELNSDKSDWISLGSHFTYFSTALNVLPGKYHLMFYCDTGSSYSFPSIAISLKAGKTYETRCFSAKDGKVGIEVKEIELPEKIDV